MTVIIPGFLSFPFQHIQNTNFWFLEPPPPPTHTQRGEGGSKCWQSQWRVLIKWKNEALCYQCSGIHALHLPIPPITMTDWSQDGRNYAVIQRTHSPRTGSTDKWQSLSYLQITKKISSAIQYATHSLPMLAAVTAHGCHNCNLQNKFQPQNLYIYYS